uniref:NADH-ubiquinone oxidoreductase chain 4L n=1 Tax=Angaria neglecta TaxID=1740283 RepID=A0A0S1F5K7_9VEST|nr:NADH dehydrogenase subunit 4L [Angaria neglecta]ALK03356.1 NADH dehydrogenase subunit 4L [Angaria neglecta]
MSISLLYVISLTGVIVSITVLCLQQKHMLMALLSLEAMTLNLFVLLMSASANFNLEAQMCLILITMGACEASLGLAILVSLIRTHGNDYVSNYTAQKC